MDIYRYLDRKPFWALAFLIGTVYYFWEIWQVWYQPRITFWLGDITPFVFLLVPLLWLALIVFSYENSPEHHKAYAFVPVYLVGSTLFILAVLIYLLLPEGPAREFIGQLSKVLLSTKVALWGLFRLYCERVKSHRAKVPLKTD